MSDKIWTLAELTDDQLKLVKEAERTLGTDYLLAFQPHELDEAGLEPASLDRSQVECLEGLEQSLNMTVVAYKKA